MTYTAGQLDEIEKALQKWVAREEALISRLFERDFLTEKANEHAGHGLMRRLDQMVHAMQRTFEVLPPDCVAPSKMQTKDATAFIQAFLFNVFGAVDNLAHIWCSEIGLLNNKRKPLRDGEIGLGPRKESVRSSFSEKFQQYLSGIDEWFAYLEGYRHALAHRIPLYIPPSVWDETSAAEYYRIEDEIGKARAERNYFRMGALMDEQSRVGVFHPVIVHSFREKSRPLRFHGQMVADLATVVEIAEYLIDELDVRLPPAHR